MVGRGSEELVSTHLFLLPWGRCKCIIKSHTNKDWPMMNHKDPWARWAILQPTHTRFVVEDWAVIWDRNVWGCVGEENIGGLEGKADGLAWNFGEQQHWNWVAGMTPGVPGLSWHGESLHHWQILMIWGRLVDMCSLKKQMIWTGAYLIKASLKTQPWFFFFFF